MFILKVQVLLSDGSITRLPLVLDTEDGKKIASFTTFDKAIEWVSCCLPGHPDIEEIKD